MRVVWSPQAREDLREIYLYIAEENPSAARLVQARVKKLVAFLKDNPHIGYPGRVPKTRELVIPRTPYIVPYRLRDDYIEILRVYHGARKWPEGFEP